MITKYTKENERKVFNRLILELKYLKQSNCENVNDEYWNQRIDKAAKKFIKDDQTLNEKNIHNFRKLAAFIGEQPTHGSLLPFNWMIGSRLGEWRFGRDRLTALKGRKSLEYLTRYPINPIGNPHYWNMEGYRFNNRWSRHVRYLCLAATYLGDFLQSGTAKVLDIGGGYGLFSGLLKQEFKQIKSGIVEFPEQLLLAYYYLAMNFPDAKINTIQEVNEVKIIDYNFIEKYDFLLIPTFCYSKIQKNSFDLITNFTSLAEMSKECFNYYLEGNAFSGAQYFFSVNRFESRPTYNSDLSILDYKLHEFQKLHFEISPLFSTFYRRKLIFFHKKEYFSSQFFEFIGKRKVID